MLHLVVQGEEVVAAGVSDLEVLLELIEAEFVAFFVLTVPVLVLLLHRIIGQVYVLTKVLELEVLGAGPNVPLLIPIPFNFAILH